MDSPSFMMIFRESAPEVYESMSAEDRRFHLDRWNAWCDELASRGALMSGNTLADEGAIISLAGGKRPIDGPFAEAKEMVGGYFLLSADSLEEAAAIGDGCPLLPFGMTVEVRPIAAACHLARSLGWETMRAPTAN